VIEDLVSRARESRPGSEVRCRDMLKPGSNVIVTQCATLDDWKQYESLEMRRAQALIRALQSGAYDGGGW
jgi:hypothetical protein